MLERDACVRKTKVWDVSDQKKVLKFVEKLHFCMGEQS